MQGLKTSPYLTPGRLGDVIAAIQTMAMYRRYRADTTRWADRISGDKRAGSYWKLVFDEHPEFFRESANYPGTYSLIWRRASPHYDLRTHSVITEDAVDAMGDEEKRQHVSRAPVPHEHIKLLIDVAVGMHGRELESRRWWVPSVVALVGSFFGALLAFAAAGMFGS